METLFVLFAGLAGLCGVAIAAAAAHGMSDLAARELLITAASFLMVHAAALLGLAAWLRHDRARLPRMAGCLWVFGLMLFAGGLSLHGFTGFTGLQAAVPVGGTALMLGWLALAGFGAARLARRR